MIGEASGKEFVKLLPGGCPRCGEPVHNVGFEEVEFDPCVTAWAMCPVTQKPILIYDMDRLKWRELISWHNGLLFEWNAILKKENPTEEEKARATEIEGLVPIPFNSSRELYEAARLITEAASKI